MQRAPSMSIKVDRRHRNLLKAAQQPDCESMRNNPFYFVIKKRQEPGLPVMKDPSQCQQANDAFLGTRCVCVQLR